MYHINATYFSSVQHFEDHNFNKVLFFFLLGRATQLIFCQRPERDAVELPRSQPKYNVIVYYVLLTVQEHDCFTN